MTSSDLHLEYLTSSPGRRMDQVVEAIRIAIDAGRMKPDVKYSVYQLAEQLGVSRTPVRDALLTLEEAGVIRFEARRGFYILLPHPREIADIFAVRLALELPAVRRTAVNATAAVHEVLSKRMQLMRSALATGDEKSFAVHDLLLHDHMLECAGNARSRTIVAGLRKSTRLLGVSTADRSRSLTDIDNEHIPIIEAVVAGRADDAVEAMRIHLVTTGQLLVAQAAREQGFVELDVDRIWADAVD
ncbi:GntR family transcriptional regulator [Rhodococcus sp. NPDC060176]|uniref:GntR family transcriptional regulator n=1 Tax=Rhodococcus sp. NPDC060176 TaxID=3347062 RepID=UPI00365F4FE4